MIAAPYPPPMRDPGVNRLGCMAELAVTETDVLGAITSLYDDLLPPRSKMIEHRIREREGIQFQVVPSSVAKLNPIRLMRLCVDMGLQVTFEADDQFSVYLPNRPADFIDTSSAADPYPPSLW
eukprot:CAMPEP_0198543702 /NCGR_PEP_ID=MMETSP1462-20131121/59805_1 /TAXON_ID=1333877 /ORGANISM="Brandtodinium nutriculum, Strain RCC3387" /LENGTH=122 /DNA_ID=CAMNT_0044273991 /DNA_START=69 /DNA_END=434 /DNA_ORIENTATION=+